MKGPQEGKETQTRGLILRVDLNTGAVTKEALSKELCSKYIGGEGVNSWLLWEHFLKVDPRTDPLGPDNVLIAGLGPLGGTCYGTGSKMKWTFKSPAYDMYGDSSCGGGFGSSLRWAGYDHVVITGRAKAPVYLWIDDDRVEIRNAEHLWGKDCEQVNRMVKKELGNERVEVATTGRAAENGVTFASLVVSGVGIAGRTGAGSVMASKNLKAIAVLGTRGIRVREPQRFVEAMDKVIAAFNRHPERLDSHRVYGTLVSLMGHQVRGGNAYRNNQRSVMPNEKAEKLSHNWYARNLAIAPLSCSPGCLRGCKGWYKVEGNESPAAGIYAGATGIKPEYLPIASFGIMLDLPDLPAVAHFVSLCNEYSMDTIEVGSCCALLMELWQRGFITRKDTVEWLGEPLSLEWGNLEAIEKVVQSIALQNNKLGQLFRRGVYKAACDLQATKNIPAVQYALYGKGGSPFIEDIRSRPSWAINMAVASRGADHLKAIGTLDLMYRPDISKLYFGTEDGAKPLDLTLKGASSVMAENRMAVINSLGLCLFEVGPDPILFPPEMFCEALSALTGEKMTAEEMRIAGERVANLEKAFNSRLGYRRQDDKLCHRWLTEPKPDEPGRGWKAEDFFEKVKDEYYQFRGWDKATSLQTRQKLTELDMLDVADVLDKEGALV